MKRLASTLIWIFAGGCLDPRLAVDPCPDGTGSAILAFVNDSLGEDATQLLAADGCRWDAPFTLSPDQAVFVLAFPFALETYQIPAGPVSTGDEGRPLPSATAIRSLERSTGQWIEQTELDPRIGSLRLPPFDLNACFGTRGCPRVDDEGYELCQPCLPEAPIAPTPPELPRLTPCPTGWSEVAGSDGGPDFCEPPEPPPSVACAPTEAQFFGAESCTRVGPACPAGEFAEDLPIGPVLYVRAGAPGGGDGSLANPMSTLDEAYWVAAPGTTIALSKGRHTVAERFMPARLAIVGACTAETEVSNPTGLVFSIDQPDIEIRSLHIVDSARGVWVRGAAASAQIEGLVVSGGLSGFVASDGAEMNLVDVLARDQEERGLFVGTMARVSVQRSAFERADVDGVLVDEAEIALEDVVIRDGQSQADDTGGVGLAAILGARLSGRRVLSENNYIHGVLVWEATAELEDLTVRGTRPERSSGRDGQGLLVANATVTLDRGLFEDNSWNQIRAHTDVGATSVLDLSDLVIRNSPERATGIQLHGGARASIRRVRVERVHDAAIGQTTWNQLTPGVNEQLGPSAIDLSDLYVRDAQAAMLIADGGSVLRAERVFADRVTDGLLIYGHGLAELKDGSIRIPGIDGRGFGLLELPEGSPFASSGLGQLSIDRASAVGGARGLDAEQPQTIASVRDLQIRNTAFLGIRVEGSTLELERASISEVTTAGLIAGSDAVVRARDLRIDGVLDGTSRGCYQHFGGSGICADRRSDVQLDRFMVTGADDRGYVGSNSTQLRFSNGVFTHNHVGVDWQDTRPRFSESFDAVQIYANEVDLQLSP